MTTGFTKKVIEYTLRKKLDGWIETITDKELAQTVKQDAFIAGGAIASMLLGQHPSDFDVYFKNKDTAMRVAKYYVEELKKSELIPKVSDYSVELPVSVIEKDGQPYIRIKSAGAVGERGMENYQYFEMLPDDERHKTQEFIEKLTEAIDSSEGKPYRPVFMTAHAITLSSGIQLIVRFTGQINDVLDEFDFAHAKLAYDYASNRMQAIDTQALQCLLSKELVYTGSKYPLASMFRMRKFLQRGFRINAGQMLKIAFDINKLDLEDVHVLEDQLIGIDIAYFHQLIREIKESNRKIDSTYVAELVEKIF